MVKIQCTFLLLDVQGNFKDIILMLTVLRLFYSSLREQTQAERPGGTYPTAKNGLRLLSDSKLLVSSTLQLHHPIEANPPSISGGANRLLFRASQLLQRAG